MKTNDRNEARKEWKRALKAKTSAEYEDAKERSIGLSACASFQERMAQHAAKSSSDN